MHHTPRFSRVDREQGLHQLRHDRARHRRISRMRTFDKFVVTISLALARGSRQTIPVTDGMRGGLPCIAQDVNGHVLVSDLGISYSALAVNAGGTDWFTAVDIGALVTPGRHSGQFTFGAGVRWQLAAARVKSRAPFTADNNGV